MKPSDYFRRQGYVTYQQDQYLEPIIPLIGEDNIIWGADYPHPDCLWPDSRRFIEKNLGMLPERVQRKITRDNVLKLYNLRQTARKGGLRSPFRHLPRDSIARAKPRSKTERLSTNIYAREDNTHALSHQPHPPEGSRPAEDSRVVREGVRLQDPERRGSR